MFISEQFLHTFAWCTLTTLTTVCYFLPYKIRHTELFRWLSCTQIHNWVMLRLSSMTQSSLFLISPTGTQGRAWTQGRQGKLALSSSLVPACSCIFRFSRLCVRGICFSTTSRLFMLEPRNLYSESATTCVWTQMRKWGWDAFKP